MKKDIKILLFLSMFISAVNASNRDGSVKGLFYIVDLVSPIQDNVCIPPKIKIGMEYIELLKSDNNIIKRDRKSTLLSRKGCLNKNSKIIYGLSSDFNELLSVLLVSDFENQNMLQEKVNLFISLFGPISQKLVEKQRQGKFDVFLWEFNSVKLLLSHSTSHNSLIVRIVKVNTDLKSVLKIVEGNSNK